MKFALQINAFTAEAQSRGENSQASSSASPGLGGDHQPLEVPEEHIEILTPAPDCRFRLEDGPERAAQVEIPEPGAYSVLLDGRVYEARVEETLAGVLVVVVEGHRFEIEVRDPRRLRRRAGASGHAGVLTVSAPMPGKVVRVLAAMGDEVRPGQGLLVVEAMKMQNEIKAPRAGKVLSMPAKEGATVTAGEVLATIG